MFVFTLFIYLGTLKGKTDTDHVFTFTDLSIPSIINIMLNIQYI